MFAYTVYHIIYFLSIYYVKNIVISIIFISLHKIAVESLLKKPIGHGKAMPDQCLFNRKFRLCKEIFIRAELEFSL